MLAIPLAFFPGFVHPQTGEQVAVGVASFPPLLRYLRNTHRLRALLAQYPAAIDQHPEDAAQLREAGASSDAIHRVHKRLRQALDYAAKKRLIAASPLAAIDPPTVRPRAVERGRGARGVRRVVEGKAGA